MKSRRIHWIIGLSGLIVGAVLGWYAQIWYRSWQPGRLVEVREDSSQYHFINPLLLVDTPREAPEYVGIKREIEKYVGEVTRHGEADSVSVYFRDLNVGKWTGVNQTLLYDPSSMLKVAVMVGYLKEASVNPAILDEDLRYVAKEDFGQYYPPSKHLTTGYYTVKQLIEAMIVDSDNVALGALYDHDRPALVAVLKSLEIPPPASLTTVDFMSPQIYSSILRTLYSSTYLPRTLSEYALQLLSLTTFQQGLVAGVPAGTVVAHKFGEHTTTDDGGRVISRQLHDCGVVYYPEKPYLLCVMTRGNNFDALQKVISDISRLAYQEVGALIKK